MVHADGAEGKRSAGRLGRPLCVDCYDYASHAVWQWFAPDMWRRFTITLHRSLAHHPGLPAARLCEEATVQYAEGGGVPAPWRCPLHALIRLDGPRSANGYEHPTLSRPTIWPSWSPGRRYLAHYATKTATDDVAPTTAHARRLQTTIADLDLRAQVAALGGISEFKLLGHCVRMLGFRGLFATKSRRYSITLGQLRRARRRTRPHRRRRASGTPLDLAGLEADLLADGGGDHPRHRPLVLPRHRLVNDGEMASRPPRRLAP